jgi:excinuclease ABC subunit C
MQNPSPAKVSLKEKVRGFPEQAGVYLMKNAEDRIIYVGKANVLRNRVRSYFASNRDIKTRTLMSHVEHIDYIVTKNEYEALLLENQLIKKWQPRYNIRLTDGKTYPVIRITNEDYPRVFRTRRIIQDGSDYFGPFTRVGAIDRYLELIEQLYPLRKCKGKVRERPHPCLYYHIGRCSAPCAGKIDREGYLSNVEGIKSLLRGETAELLEELTRRMEAESAGYNFERAAYYRDMRAAIEELQQEQTVMDFDLEVRDYVAVAEKDELASFVVFQMRGGKLVGSDVFRTEVFASDEEDLLQFLLQYYSSIRSAPTKLFLGSASVLDSTKTFLEERFDSEVQVAVPHEQRDRSIMNMAAENARQDLEQRIRDRGNLPALEELQRALSLPGLPFRIEGFDIAQLSGKYPVASMVSFKNGVPDKAKYRRFHVKTLGGKIDDFEAMREVVARRYMRVVNDELEKPDLILIDGGIGQVNAAKGVLTSLGLEDIAVIGLAKQNEEIFFPHQSDALVLPKGSPPLRILQHVRDESHRFATGFRASLQSKDLGSSQLETVPGIGPKRSKKLLQAFGSIPYIIDAEAEEVAEVAGIPTERAHELQDTLRSGSRG